MTPLHIPDDELHAYLDQALPRSRCVKLESHLAACPGCRARRDATAALRDRTTLLLASLAPERKRIPPSFEELQRRSAARPAARFAWRDLAWAASILLAVGVGYGMRSSAGGAPVPVPAGQTVAAVEALTPSPAESAPAIEVSDEPRARRERSVAPARDTAARTEDREAMLALAETPPPPRSTQISTDTLPRETAPTTGLWRTVPWTEAKEQMGSQPPRVDGVPVVEVQVQSGRDRQGGRPVTVVAQQLSSGELITTIEGPVDDVWALLSRRGDRGDTAGAETLRQGSRLLAVTGELPADSLRAMVRRVNAARRVQ
ncbi:MAG TPA: zf-HC2 domain-containing protein [Gemmatimonadales bacterium]|nr:zf-HC2 domain-containing protein [Gemmatimonadales bacterium]